jgi:predicted Zn finger-like uncharacterized protein
MALAARCPHCRALFRVVADQLKLRGGMVRCGECRQVFDAISSLSYVDNQVTTREQAEAPVGGAALPGPAMAPPAGPPPRPREPVAPAAAANPARVARPFSPTRRAAGSGEVMRDELAVPTLFGIAEPQSTPPSNAARGSMEVQLAQAGYRNLVPAPEADDSSAPPAAEAEEAPIEAPSFLPTEDQRRQQRQRRALAIACIPLTLLAVFHLALALRNGALETWPSLRPLLMSACRVYGCTVGWPAHSELLTIVGSELASIPGTDVIELNAAVRSRANFIMALPAIEVTLTDTQNRTVARKVFLPADYLAASGEPSSRIDEGLAPGSDLSVRLVFEARGLSASGFVLYPFYL